VCEATKMGRPSASLPTPSVQSYGCDSPQGVQDIRSGSSSHISHRLLTGHSGLPYSMGVLSASRQSW
jgi:hypothetical protein